MLKRFYHFFNNEYVTKPGNGKYKGGKGMQDPYILTLLKKDVTVTPKGVST